MSPKLPAAIAAPVVGQPVHLVEEERVGGHREDENPARLQGREGPAKGAEVVVDVLQDVEEGDHAPGPGARGGGDGFVHEQQRRRRDATAPAATASG